MFLPIANTQEMRREHTDAVFVQTLSQRGGHLWVRRRDGGREAGRSKVTRNEPDPTCAVGERRATRLDPARRGFAAGRGRRAGGGGGGGAFVSPPGVPRGGGNSLGPPPLWGVVSPPRVPCAAGASWRPWPNR